MQAIDIDSIILIVENDRENKLLSIYGIKRVLLIA